MSEHVHLYIAISLDGFIATEDGGVGWLEAFHTEGDDFGYAAFLESVDNLVMGRVTFEQVLGFGEWPYAGKRCIVLSQGLAPDTLPEGVSFSRQVPTECRGKTWLVGGRQTVQTYLAAGKLGTIELFVMPTILGTGIPLFTGGTPPQSVALTEHKIYPNGVVRLLYQRR